MPLPKILSTLLSSLLLFALPCSTAAAQRLVASWSFDAMTGDTFRDVSGNGHDAAASGLGVTTAKGIQGNALSCPGSGFEIVVKNSRDSLNLAQFSVEGWLYLRANDNTPHIVDFQDLSASYGNRNGWGIYINGSQQMDFGMSNSDGSAYGDVVVPSIVQFNTWYHFVCTYDNAVMKVYLNGALSGSIDFPGGYLAPHADLRIGCLTRSNGDVEYNLNGLIDELKIFDFALPADSIRVHYNGALLPPTLLSPANGTTQQPLALNLLWSPVAGAASYGAQIATASDFATTVFSQSGITGTIAAASGLSGNSTYYWRVNASSQKGTSGWSTAWSFSTVGNPPAGAPILLSPASGSGNQPRSLGLYWTAVTGATWYAVQVSTDAGFGTVAVNQNGLTGTSATVNGLARGTLYYWRANGANSAGSSDWSAVWSFTTTWSSSAGRDLDRDAKAAVAFRNGILSYTLPAAGAMTISVCDIRGKNTTLVNRNLGPGNYRLSLKDYRLSPGMYILHLAGKGIDRTITLLLPK